MPFDPEQIRSLFNEHEEYAEDFRERYGSSPVLERAMKLQRGLSETRLIKDDVDAAWNVAQETLLSLEAEAAESNILGQTATLRGPGLEIPKLESDSTRSIGLITLSEFDQLNEASIERYFIMAELKGVFAGFTLRFLKNSDESYTPQLAYQVTCLTIDLPHAHVNLYATGIIGTTEIIFEHDEKIEQVTPILEKLFTLCPEQATSINNINVALSSTNSHDASVIRHIAYHAEKIHNEVDKNITQPVGDTLLDLIAYYIEPGSGVTFKTSAYALSPENDQKDAEYHEDENHFEIKGQNYGYEFLPRVVIKNGEVIYQDHQALHIVIDHQGRNLFSPLIRTQEFSRE